MVRRKDKTAVALSQLLDSSEEFSERELRLVRNIIKTRAPSCTLRKNRGGKTFKFTIGNIEALPVNPVSGFEFTSDCKAVFDYFFDFESCGQFATKLQWLKVDRKCVGSPLVVEKGEFIIEYYPYEQTRSEK